jgi:hypothetical protein
MRPRSPVIAAVGVSGCCATHRRRKTDDRTGARTSNTRHRRCLVSVTVSSDVEDADRALPLARTAVGTDFVA